MSPEKNTMRRFYAPPDNFFANGITKLDADETRHLRDVLRLRVGDEVSVFDGTGREFHCAIQEIEKKNSNIRVLEQIDPASPESSFEITLAATILNGEKYDLIIQKAVELGVAAFVPLQTARSEVDLKDAEKRLQRWRRIALEATKQSGRAKIMRIDDPVGFDALISSLNKDDVVLFSERNGGDFLTLTPGKKITVLIGPKGGWADHELDAASSKGINIVTLGGRILRAETAAISITAILQHRFGDLK